MMQLTKNKGPLYLTIDLGWKYSDDTVMHIATAKALTQSKIRDDIPIICQKIGLAYK